MDYWMRWCHCVNVGHWCCNIRWRIFIIYMISKMQFFRRKWGYQPSIHPSISIWNYGAVHVPFDRVAAPSHIEHQLALHASLPCKSMPHRPHFLTSLFTHSDYIFLGLSCPLVLGKCVTDLIQGGACHTCPDHLSCWLRRTAVIFSMPGL